MRIISGKFKGRLLISSSGNNIRPTSDRAREMIFSTLNSILLKDKKSLEDLSVLDCFCGTGALGIEAISRGAKNVTFIDSSIDSLNVCKLNCKRLEITSISKTVKLNIMNANLNSFTKRFDLLLCDPPYSKFTVNQLIDKIGILLNNDSYGVLELPEEIKSIKLEDFEVLKMKIISKSQFIFLKKN